MESATNIDMLKEAWQNFWRPVKRFFYNIGQIFKYAYRCMRYGKHGYA